MRVLTWALALIVGAVLVTATSYWVFSRLAPGDSVPDPLADKAMIARGASVYAASCATCHGNGGEGQPLWRERNPDGTLPPPPHDSTGHTWHHGDGTLYRIVAQGGQIFDGAGFKSAMPAFQETLNSEEIRAVIVYLKTLWGPAELERQKRLTLQDPFP